MHDSHEHLVHQVKTLHRRFYIIAALFVALGLLNVAFLLNVQYRLWQPQNSRETSVAQLDIKPVIKKDYQVSLTSFYNNAAISEVAYQLELKKQSISTRGTTNCSTPEVPPVQNGCGFVIRPYAAGIPNKKSRLLKLQVVAQMGGQDKIAFDLKNTDSNEIETAVGTIEGRYQNRSIRLPDQLKANQQIFVRLWPAKGSEVTIKEIIVESLNYDQLQPVDLELPQAYSQGRLQLYLDINNDKRLDSNDVLWTCANGFPGVQDINLTGSAKISLVRDDSCIGGQLPEQWQNDNGKNALPPYNWLAVILDKDNQKTVFSFEVTKEKNTFVINKL